MISPAHLGCRNKSICRARSPRGCAGPCGAVAHLDEVSHPSGLQRAPTGSIPGAFTPLAQHGRRSTVQDSGLAGHIHSSHTVSCVGDTQLRGCQQQPLSVSPMGRGSGCSSEAAPGARCPRGHGQQEGRGSPREGKRERRGAGWCEWGTTEQLRGQAPVLVRVPEAWRAPCELREPWGCQGAAVHRSCRRRARAGEPQQPHSSTAPAISILGSPQVRIWHFLILVSVVIWLLCCCPVCCRAGPRWDSVAKACPASEEQQHHSCYPAPHTPCSHPQGLYSLPRALLCCPGSPVIPTTPGRAVSQCPALFVQSFIPVHLWSLSLRFPEEFCISPLLFYTNLSPHPSSHVQVVGGNAR